MTQTQLYVVTYGNRDGETITRGPVSAIGALGIADDVAAYIPSWSRISFFMAGDYDGQVFVTRQYLEAHSAPVIGSPATCYHGEVGIVSHVYKFSSDVELEMDESHADVYRGTFCYTTALIN